jgi:hypothetical protein
MDGSADNDKIANPAPIDCRTCHDIHETGTDADWALTTTAAVVLDLGAETYDKGKSNLCAECHQARTSYDIPVTAGLVSGKIEISSSRYGPHHGPQSGIMLGVLGAGISDSASVHYTLTTDGCVECHMSDAYGSQAGGHTWSMSYEYHGSDRGLNASCKECHTSATDIPSYSFNRTTRPATNVEAIEGLMADLKAQLILAGYINDSNSVLGASGSSASSSNKLLLDLGEAEALWNYKTIQEDRSNGSHNPTYVKDMLAYAIANMTTAGYAVPTP